MLPAECERPEILDNHRFSTKVAVTLCNVSVFERKGWSGSLGAQGSAVWETRKRGKSYPRK